ncbi:MAG TPA: APC family permease [Ruminococcaceae bacterium]|nr:APC family permease [Oscillospiraceae bacterium]
MNIKNLLLGKPLKNTDIKGQKLSKAWGLPLMASDAVSSVAYAGQEILLVLVPVIGLGAFHFVPWIALSIMLLLLILIVSYSQIIDHYPSGGGAYLVSKENLGKMPSLLAASSLIIDYIMTVAVSVSSASEAIVAAFPGLTPVKIWLAVAFVLLVTLGNLRGIQESARLFGTPTYIFIGCLALLIIVGFIRLLTGSLHPMVYSPNITQGLSNSMTGLSLVLILRAFASGCSALTGVEAVSNAIPNFKEPAQHNAKMILAMLGGVIIFLFGGTTLLGLKLQIIPVNGTTILSQISTMVFGNSFLFYFIQLFTAIILILAANTAYNGLPLLLYILAHDGFVPRQFSHRGTKLSFSNGIMFICIVAILLVVVFGASTHRLIPLYSVGVFISFTLSQYGMFRKWHKLRDKGWQHKMWINGFGALVTLVGVCVVMSSKFIDGAWMIAIAIPVLMLIMNYINKHYEKVGEELTLKRFHPYYEQSASHKTQAIVLMQSINKSLLKSLNYANAISDNVTVLHICRHAEHAKELQKNWADLGVPAKLEIVITPYQDIITPLDKYIKTRERALKHGDSLSVIIIKFISEHWYDAVLHTQTTYFLERVLSRHKNVSSIILPFHYNPNISPEENRRNLFGNQRN